MNKKNVLVISNNPLSNVQNNGKTLASLVNRFDPQHIYQIYFSSEYPDYNLANYLRINEQLLLKSIIHRNESWETVESIEHANVTYNPGSSFKKIELVRLLRELIWATKKWKNKKLVEWLQSFSPDYIVFLAGDTLFSYSICEYVSTFYSLKPIVMITDDYICRKTYSIIANIRRRLILKKMRKMVLGSAKLITISDKMKAKYEKLFCTDSFVFRNVDDASYKLPAKHSNDCLGERIIYAGGLHLNRWKTLAKCSEAIFEINKINCTNFFIEIYTAQKVDGRIRKKIEKNGTAIIKGAVPKEQLFELYNSSGCLLIVESFDKGSVYSTMYSFSTKISEYLSCGKCVIAIGPQNIGSMEYLQDCAYTINGLKNLKDSLRIVLSNSELRKRIGEKCKKKYDFDFSSEKMEETISKIFDRGF